MFSNRIRLALCCLSAFACVILVPSLSSAQPKGESSVTDVLSPIPLSDIQLEGHVGKKLDLCIQNRILDQNVDALVDPFKTRTETVCWQTEFWGKWYTALARAYQYKQTDALRQKLEEAASKLMATQTDDGYIGNYAPDHRLTNWDVWGRKYSMLGLLADYDATGNEAALDSAKRLADYTLKELGPGKGHIVHASLYRGMPASSILEAIVPLYLKTGEKKYLDFAKWITTDWEIEDGPDLIGKALQGIPVAKRFPIPGQLADKKWWSWENGMKGYEMLNCYEGLAMLYRVTGEPDYLEAVKEVYKDVRDNEIQIDGGGTGIECFFGAAHTQTQTVKHMGVTCTTVLWIKLCNQVLQLTGDPLVADEIERAFYNAYLGTLKTDGSWFTRHNPLSGYRSQHGNQCQMNQNCCVANGPRTITLFPELVVMQSEEGPVVNFYEACQAKAKAPSGNQVEIEVQGDYPKSGRVAIRVNPEKPESFVMKFRIPAWSDQTVILLNGKPQEHVRAGAYYAIDRKWQPGDTVEIDFDFRGRIVYPPDSRTHFAIMRGPILLARDNRLGSQVIDETVTPVQENNGRISLEPVTPPDPDIWMAFKAPLLLGPYEKEASVTLCDFSSAGNNWDDGQTRYRVWLPLLLDPSKIEDRP